MRRLHLPAIAHEAGLAILICSMCAEIFRDTPYFCRACAPVVKYVAKDMYEAGGVPVVMKELRKAGSDCMKIALRPPGAIAWVRNLETDHAGRLMAG